MSIWRRNSKYDLPQDFEWEYHNKDAEELAKAKLKGGDLGAWDEYLSTYQESAEERERRWANIWYEKEKFQRQITDWKQFNENPDEFLKKAEKMEKHLSKWWFTIPKRVFGKGKLHRTIVGGWWQEYKPTKTMRMKDWLEASDRGNVFNAQLNKEHKPIPKEPNSEILEKDRIAREQRTYNWWMLMFNKTNNFGKGMDAPLMIPGRGSVVKRDHTFVEGSKFNKKFGD